MNLLSELKRYYAKEGRGHLPWRKTRDPYKVLVSEVMLQQTQVERVIPKYKEFLRAFPSVKALAKAPFSQVLFHWNGLGYNRRAKFLHDAAKAVVREYGGILPKEPEVMEKLPGIGHYTARAVAAFAHNAPHVFLETNIRTVFLHHYFPEKTGVSDQELLSLVEGDLKRSKMEPREFYAALMDYGSFLKRSGVRINHKSKHYAKQPPFAGSARQLRGIILRELLKGPQDAQALHVSSGCAQGDVTHELERLAKEGLIRKKGGAYVLSA